MSFEPHRPLSRHRFESRILANSRDVWVQTASHPRSHRGTALFQGIVLFLDAEHYLEDLGAVEIVEALQQRSGIPSYLPVYVSHIDYKTRWRESFCNPEFAAFVATELLPWISKEFDQELDVDGESANAIVGLSLTGLAAAHAGLQYPDTVAQVICQSGSFWWHEGWLIDEVSNRPLSDLAVHLSVGLAETNELVDHGEGLLQKESQLSSNRRMRDALASRGFKHSYCEFEGDHNLASFRRDLPNSLGSLLAL